MSNKISDLKQPARERAEGALSELKNLGVKVSVTSTLRTKAEQAAYYAQGRQPVDVVNRLRIIAGLYVLSEKENGYTVTNCDGEKHKSRHQSGLALDVVPVEKGRAIWPPANDERWQVIANVFKQHGFTWGGDWKEFPDHPHYQIGS